ncbi:MAG: radical SAM protein [Deltaproteobacteria bacterium]|jgi:radical SAM protein with 4Fe4S-binding SPASM domain|nr:radical SAM protein [Deltaproteobacteria bacterium]
MTLKQVGIDSLKVSRFLAQEDPLALLTRELGPKFVSYRQAWDEARTFKRLPPFPIHVDYELKAECDLKCPICPRGGLNNQLQKSSKELSGARVKRLIKKGAALGQSSMGFGGLWEPLTSPVAELVALGREMGLVDVILSTNGQRLTRAVSQDLIAAGLTRLMISVDAATPRTYAKTRPGGDYGLLENNIYEFLAARKKAKSRLPLLRLSFCLTNLNEGELEAFLAKWSKVVDFFSIQSYGLYSSAKGQGLFPKKTLYPVPGGRCAQPWKRLLVRHDGLVAPCCDLSGYDLAIGDISKQSLGAIWNSHLFKNVRESLAGPKDSWPAQCVLCQDKYAPVN